MGSYRSRHIDHYIDNNVPKSPFYVWSGGAERNFFGGPV